jgi:hypothetical protein
VLLEGKPDSGWFLLHHGLEDIHAGVLLTDSQQVGGKVNLKVVAVQSHRLQQNPGTLFQLNPLQQFHPHLLQIEISIENFDTGLQLALNKSVHCYLKVPDSFAGGAGEQGVFEFWADIEVPPASSADGEGKDIEVFEVATDGVF